MKVIKWILIIIGVIVVLFLGWSATQPSKLQVEHTVQIDASPAQVFAAISDYPNWNQWAVWNQIDSNMVTTYEGTPGEVGSVMAWKSDHPQVGNGRQEVVEVVANELLKTKLNFGEGMGDNYATFRLSAVDGGTSISWDMDGAETPFYLNGMNTIMKPMVKQSYETSLNQLKAYVESMPAASASSDDAEMEIVEVSVQKVLTMADTVSVEEISGMLEKAYGEMIGLVSSTDGVEMAGMPMGIYHSFTPERVVMEAAIPIMGDIEPSGDIMVKEIPAGKALRAVHYGSYDASGLTHNAMEAYMTENGLEYAGACWEVYANDPEMVDSADVETHIFYPIK